jgi:S1-C subfamily serine protease
MKTILTVFFAFFSFNVYSQYLLSGKEIFTYEDLPKKITIVKRSSASIERYDSSKKTVALIGSSFIVKKKLEYYAVTNYHVVRGKEKGFSILIGFNASMKKQYYRVKQTYLDTINDIAVLKMGEPVSFINTKIDTTLTEPAWIGISMFESSVNIKEGTGVIIIGYPLSLGAKYTGNRPVSRIGIIAQELNSETNTFLLDGMANQGNSGSPVFNEQNLKLIGMVTATQQDRINLYDNNEVVRASLPYNSIILP